MEKATKSGTPAPESASPETPSLGNAGGELIAAAAGAGQELQSQVVGLTHQVRQQATEQITTPGNTDQYPFAYDFSVS